VINMLNLAAIKIRSQANGPGMRSVIWTQGCSLGCEGCFNESMRPFEEVMRVKAKQLARWLAELPVAGLTVSGGEPFDQAAGLYDLLGFYRESCDKTIMVFTGYTFEELKAAPRKIRAALLADALVSGRFVGGGHWENKKLILPTGRIKASEISAAPSLEAHISGFSTFLTGYPVFQGGAQNDLPQQGVADHA